MKRLIFVFLITMCSVTSAQDAYLCIPKSATGYSYIQVTNSWEMTSFSVGNDKYLLKNKSKSWNWDRFGESNSFSTCKEIGSQISCARLGGDVIFDKKTLRYLRTYIAGYVDGVNNNNNTPLIEIGTCSPL